MVIRGWIRTAGAVQPAQLTGALNVRQVALLGVTFTSVGVVRTFKDMDIRAVAACLAVA